MPINNSKSTEVRNETSYLQTFVFGFVLLVAALLIIVPTLPMLISNLAYSFSGDKPKIYWYLSRSGGFVTLTILWAAMALGIGITNKMARLWPGAPTAFAVHQYTSLLGLAFAAYHGLVLMGDHFVDFSLPRLITPFSIEYKTVWVGLGQICFYAWLFVVLSFYARSFIGQKTWRLIHYVNFATYVMGFLHGIMTGWDSTTLWAHGYYWVSGGSLVALLVYRIYDSKLKGKNPFSQFVFKRAQGATETSKATVSIPTAVKVTSVPQALLRAQAKDQASASVETSQSLPVANIKEEKTVVHGDVSAVESGSGAKRTESNPKSSPHITRINNDKVKVRIFKEPTTRPIPELQKSVEHIQEDVRNLFTRVRQSLQVVPVEPTTPNRKIRNFRSSSEE